MTAEATLSVRTIGVVAPGSVRDAGGFTDVWRSSELFTSLREPRSAGACASCGSYDACQGGCMAAKFFTGLPLDGPDPECVQGHSGAFFQTLSNPPSDTTLPARKRSWMANGQA